MASMKPPIRVRPCHVLLAAALLSCSAAVLIPVACLAEDEPESLRAMEDLSAVRNTSAKAVSPVSDPGALRAEAIREAAETLGMQAGVKWRYDIINGMVEGRAAELDRIYDFAPLMMHSGRVRPPVIVEANGTETLTSDVESTASDTTWEIHEDAKVIISPPSWRDYLIQQYAVNEEINPLMRPKDAEEEKRWAENVRRGWADGVAQADTLFEVNLNRLNRDFRGMLRFHRLAEQNIVAVPDFAVGDLGVTVNGRKLDVNQRLFQITGQAGFNADPSQWKMKR